MFSLRVPSACGTSLASAKYNSSGVTSNEAPSFELANTIPSYPTFISSGVMPFALHFSTSLDLIALLAFVKSG